jgi:hypothetical protein
VKSRHRIARILLVRQKDIAELLQVELDWVCSKTALVIVPGWLAAVSDL